MNMRAFLFASGVVLLAALSSGCGQGGALYFTEDPPADQLPPSRKQAAVSPLPVPAAPASAPSPAVSAPANSPAAAPTDAATTESPTRQ